MKSVFEINDYREACKFLQKKYDKIRKALSEKTIITLIQKTVI